MIELRPMTVEDLDGVILTAGAAFDHDPTGSMPARRRLRAHVLETDPDGQWVAVDAQGAVAGAASALRRGGLWGLSLFVVRPEHQSAGLGRRLLDASLTTAESATGGLILSSDDPRALRRYGRAGFELHPALHGTGVVRREELTWPAAVRAGGAEDLAAAEPVSVAVRGTSHEADLAVFLETGGRLLVAEGGYAVVTERRLAILAATAPATAVDLLTAALLTVPEGQEAEVRFVTGAQQWAFPVLLAAGLALRPSGPVCSRGTVGPLSPYLPSGAFL